MVKICTIVILGLAYLIGADIMPNGAFKMRFSGLAASKISAAFCTVYMVATVRQVLLKRFIIDKRLVTWLAEKGTAINK